MARSPVAPVPVRRLKGGNFVEDCEPEDLVYFLLNVGDGDTQLVLLPAEGDKAKRAAVVVDIATDGKLPALLESLEETPLLPERRPLFEVVVATHPHSDHIGGMPEFLDRFAELVCELWEPGYHHPSDAYHELLRALEDADTRGGDYAIRHVQPTSGLKRFIGNVKLTVLSPGIGLRNRFDTYGVTLNNASISLKIEFPAARVEERDGQRRFLRLRETQGLILGADAQTLSWAQAMVDFPELRPEDSPVAKALRMASGSNHLRAQVFKVPHHASKHGLSLELVELIRPKLCLVSSVGGGGKYHFPHRVAQESMREAIQSTAAGDAERRPDHDLGIHYTGGSDSKRQALGSIALVLSPNGRKRHLWRFGDLPAEAIDLKKARRFT